MLNGTSIASKTSELELTTESCPSHPSLLTCVSSYSPVQLDSIEALRTWLQEAFPASPSQSQASNSEPTTPEICGPLQSQSSEKSGHAIAFLRTYQGFCPLPTIAVENVDAGTLTPLETTEKQLSFAPTANLRWSSPQLTLFGTSATFSETWPKAGTTADGAFYPQPSWERRISAIASGLWRTPDAHEWKNRSCSTQIYLEDQIMQRPHKPVAFPTPRTVDSRDMAGKVKIGKTGRLIRESGENFSVSLGTMAARNMWPTPTAQDASNNGGSAQMARNTKPLNAEVVAWATWPTPRGRDDRTVQVYANSENHGDLNQEVAKADPTAVGGKLNPTWVEWLQGWPLGWTSLEPLPMQQFEEWADAISSGQWWPQEPDIPRITNEVSNRVDRLKALGNGQVPATAAAAWSLLTNAPS